MRVFQERQQGLDGFLRAQAQENRHHGEEHEQRAGKRGQRAPLHGQALRVLRQMRDGDKIELVLRGIDLGIDIRRIAAHQAGESVFLQRKSAQFRHGFQRFQQVPLHGAVENLPILGEDIRGEGLDAALLRERREIFDVRVHHDIARVFAAIDSRDIGKHIGIEIRHFAVQPHGLAGLHVLWQHGKPVPVQQHGKRLVAALGNEAAIGFGHDIDGIDIILGINRGFQLRADALVQALENARGRLRRGNVGIDELVDGQRGVEPV